MSRGFTLLEVVVALAVFGFLVLGVAETTRFGLLGWRTEGALSDRSAGLEAADRLLRTIVRNLAPADDPGRPAITGTNATLSGISRMPVPDLGLAEAPVEIALALSANRLVLRWRPYRHAEAFAAEPVREEILVGNVQRFGVEYWRPNGGWSATWSQPDLPVLVRFRLRFAGPRPPVWPDLVTAPLLSRP